MCMFMCVFSSNAGISKLSSLQVFDKADLVSANLHMHVNSTAG